VGSGSMGVNLGHLAVVASGGIGGGGVQDEADRLGLGVPVGQGNNPRSVGLWPGLLGEGEAVPGPLVEPGQHHIGSVDLVAGGAEVLPDRADHPGWATVMDNVFGEADNPGNGDGQRPNPGISGCSQ